MKPRVQTGFTLIEMLTVLVIVAIMTSIALVAVTRIGRSAKLQTAATEFVNTLALARQYAIMNHTTCGVILSANPTAPDLSFTNVAPLFTSYAVAANPGGSVYYSPAADNPGWRYITPWRRLPTGVVFDLTPWSGGSNAVWQTIRGVASVYRINFPADDSPLVPTAYAAISYRAFDSKSITLREGYFDPNRLALGAPYYGLVWAQPGARTNKNVNTVTISLSWASGKITVTRK